MRRGIIATLAIVAMVGCSKDNETTHDVISDSISDVAVSFLHSNIATRTTGNEWDDDDEIGITMFRSGGMDLNYALSRFNAHYTTDSNGEFSTADDEEPIYYPQSDEVDFYAYYPYQEGVTTDNIYTVDLTLQNPSDGNFDQGAVDFITASIKGVTKSSDALSFSFDHMLSKLSFEITPDSTMSTLEDMVVTVTQIKTEGDFNALTGAYISSSNDVGSIVLQVDSSTESNGDVTAMSVSAIVLPEAITADTKMTFKCKDGVIYPGHFATGTTFQAGKNHSYTVKINNGAALIEETTIDAWEASKNDSDKTFNADAL